VYCAHTEDHRAIYDRLQRALDSFSDNVSIRIRMGVMPYQKDLGPIELFDRARTACSMVRGGHHSKLMVFNEEMRKREILEQRLLGDLRNAIDNDEFMVYYQPKYNIQTDTPGLESAEALVRWKHHELGMIPPGEFINLFEKQGQIGIIDKYVWHEAANRIGEWKKKYGITIPVSVNLSRIDIFDQNLIQTIDEIITQNGLERSDLHLEVTESAYTDDAEQIIGVVKNLRSLGYFIEMDDFGTGYSSLNMLSAMPVDVLKLDKSFIDNVEKTGGKEEKDIRLVELILDIAKSLKLIVVAEGVENEKQLLFLKKRGCEMVQGYYFSPALPAEGFEKLAFGDMKEK
jgi:EAL domain-containing protein (putative c-di-GMP-specific phosphodiesterase class I)